MGINKSNLLEFSHIPPEAGVWRQVLHLGERLTFRKGSEIMSCGKTEACLYFLYQGEVRLIRTTLDGRMKILIFMTAGCVMGEIPFFTETPTRSSFVAATDCVVYSFSQDCVRHEIIPCYPELTWALFRSMASKGYVLGNQVFNLGLGALPSCICTFLRLRMRDGDKESCVSPGLTQQELADLLGVHRVSLNKALRELEKAFILGPYTKNEVYVLDMERFLELTMR